MQSLVPQMPGKSESPFPPNDNIVYGATAMAGDGNDFRNIARAAGVD